MSKGPISFKIPKSNHHGLMTQVDEGASFYSELHYHPEIQITAIEKGDGILYAGNQMCEFKECQLFIIGGNVPHLFKCKTSTIKLYEVKSSSLFFDELSFGQQFFKMSEMVTIKNLMDEANRVIKISGTGNESLFQRVIGSVGKCNEDLVIESLMILSEIQRAEKIYLHDTPYHLTLTTNEGGRLNNVLEYTFENYQTQISIQDVCSVAHLSRSQFSHFFKLHTGRTFVQFLNNLRVESACIQLKIDQKTVEQICYEVGFRNISNFSRQFKQFKGVTPSGFRNQWKKLSN